MENQMINSPDGAGPHAFVLRECSDMDQSVVARLRATVEISVTWAEQALDILIRLDDDLQAMDASVKQQLQSVEASANRSEGEPETRLPAMTGIAQQTEQSVQLLRNTVRDIMMSMQQQDVIGQAVERVASAIERRAAAIGKIVDVQDSIPLNPAEIVEIHRAYRTEDDRHRSAGWDH